MKIDRAEVIVTSPDRNYVTLKLTTDEGLTGLGDATLNGRELAVVAYLTEHVVPLLIGKNAHQIEDMWQFLYRSAYWRRGPVTMAAIAAVDVALWDIKAKAAGMPLYQLLGGASRTGLLAYGHASGKSTEELFDSVRAHQEQGYKAIRIQTGVPGLTSIYGIASNATLEGNKGQRYDHEPAQRGALPAEEDWDTRSYLRHVPSVFEAVRNEFGPELPLLHDGHHRMTPIQAAKLGKSLEPYDLFWLEDCTPAENPGGAAAGAPAHHHPARDRRDLQHGLGLPADHPRATHRLRAQRGHPHRRHHPPQEDARVRLRSTRSSPACTARPTSRRSAWPPRCTSASPSTTSESRNT